MHSDDRQILLYLEDRLSQADRDLLEGHIGRCGSCAARFADLSKLPSLVEEEPPVMLDEETRRKAVDLIKPGKQTLPMSFLLSTPRYRVALAGAAALLVVVSVYLFIPREDTVQFRSDRVEGTGALELFPEDGARVGGPDFVFRWTSLGESMAYRFSLLRETGAVIWSADLRDTTISLPATIVLQPGKTYLWRIETSLADKKLERSAVHAFTYSPD